MLSRPGAGPRRRAPAGRESMAPPGGALSRALTLRREAEDDVEPRRQLADPRPLDRGEVDEDGVAGPGVLDPPQDAVPRVPRLPFHVALGREQLLAAPLDLEVD